MVQAVANQVQQRICDLFENGFVQFGVFALDNQIDLFTKLVRNTTNCSLESIADVFNRNHADMHQAILSITIESLLASKQ